MIVYSILNFKGGTGKSSLAENLSHALARAGKKVLVIDADRQTNSSSTLLAGQATPTLTDVLKGEVSLSATIKQARENLYVVPSDGDLDTASPYILSHRAAYYLLRKQLQQLEDIFICLIDHAGAYTPVMESCLLASNAMLIPCELEPYATQGLFSMFRKLGETLVDHELRNAGIIPYNVDLRYGMAKQYLTELRQEFNGFITTAIRTDAIVPKAQSVKMTVFEYEEEYGVKSRAAEDFLTLAEDLVEEIEEVTR